MRNYLISTVKEMVTTTVRTAYSTCFSEGEDFTCGLFDRNGDMIAQAAGISVHAGGLSILVRHFLDKFGDFEPGDVVIHNDPYTGATHQGDGAIFRPMFYENMLVGFSINRGHWTDIGGMAPGGWSGTASHVVQEALRLPATKLYQAGVLNGELREIIEHNVRFARQWWGDVQSHVASNITAERRLQALIRKNGLDAVLASFEAAKQYSRTRFLKAMEAMPNTSVTVSDVYMEDNGFGEGPFRVQINLTKTPRQDRRRLCRHRPAVLVDRELLGRRGARRDLHTADRGPRSPHAAQSRCDRSHRVPGPPRLPRQSRLSGAVLCVHCRPGRSHQRNHATGAEQVASRAGDGRQLCHGQ